MNVNSEGYECCNGCGLCILPCPVWRQTGDIRLTFVGRARSLQSCMGAPTVMEASRECILCGSCEPACPMGIRTLDITMRIRTALDTLPVGPAEGGTNGSAHAPDSLLPDAALLENRYLLDGIADVLRLKPLYFDCSWILESLFAGRPLPADKVRSFLASFHGIRRLAVADGLMKRFFRLALPGLRVTGLGESLLRLPGVRSSLRQGDLYIIDSRGYNADFDRSMPFYSSVRNVSGCSMNLDLQRIAIPTGSFLRIEPDDDDLSDRIDLAHWIIRGRSFDRIVAETLDDVRLFFLTTTVPVLHISKLAGLDLR